MPNTINLDIVAHMVENPVNPLLLEPSDTINLRALLLEWDNLVGGILKAGASSVAHCSYQTVRDRIGNRAHMKLVWSLEGLAFELRQAVDGSTVDAMAAYYGSMFQTIVTWNYCHIVGVNPWSTLLALWNGGYVPSFNNDTNEWRLHCGVDARIVLSLALGEGMVKHS